MKQPTCPECHKPALRRAVRNNSDQSVRNLFMSPYRCEACGHRLWKISSRVKYRTALTVSVLLLGFAVGALIYQVSATRAITSVDLFTQDNEKTLLPLAKKGDPEAAYQLAMIYKEGRGVLENAIESAKWFRVAAEKNHAEAQFHLGLAYKAGRGTLQNFSEAVKWFEKAAMQDNANGQYNLGLMYRTGQGIPLDNTKAYFWFNLAAAKAHPRAAEARDMVMLSMTPMQISDAQKEANAWTPPGASSSNLNSRAALVSQNSTANSFAVTTLKEPPEKKNRAAGVLPADP